MMKVQLSEESLNWINDWCAQVQEKRIVRDLKNNDNHEARIDREITGKIGELVVACCLGLRKNVDWNLYKKGSVQFTGDLGKHLHVKTCGLNAKNTELDSWLVDKSDNLLINPHKNDIVYLAYANTSGVCEILGWVKAVDIKWIWRKSEKLDHKFAVYIDEIKHLIKPIPVKKSKSKFFQVI